MYRRILTFSLTSTVILPSWAAGQRADALLQDYFKLSVTASPESLGLDPFYKKYVSAHGIPVVSSDKTPDAALLVARDMVQLDDPRLYELIAKVIPGHAVPGNVYTGRLRR